MVHRAGLRLRFRTSTPSLLLHRTCPRPTTLRLLSKFATVPLKLIWRWQRRSSNTMSCLSHPNVRYTPKFCCRLRLSRYRSMIKVILDWQRSRHERHYSFCQRPRRNLYGSKTKCLKLTIRRRLWVTRLLKVLRAWNNTLMQSLRYELTICWPLSSASRNHS